MPTSFSSTLQSFIAGRWQGLHGVQPLRSALNGQTLTYIHSEPLDFAEVLEHGRSVGVDALLALDFQQRAARLKALALYLKQHKEQLYAISYYTGATRNDSWIDIEGGISTLFSYASQGARGLPSGNIYHEGPPVALGAQGHFMGTHILVPRGGVAVHINAFNFPVWGLLEKFSPSFLAGVPCVVKPATCTSYLAHALVQLMDASGLLPAGSLQLIIGGTGDLLDRLNSQDAVTFTGSASTAAKLRVTPNLIHHAVPFNTEADSLNCAILGPDIYPGEPEFELFIQEVAREMTVKAGQKCTAIRRAIVPEDLIGVVTTHLCEYLGQIVTGDPALPEVTMGALASHEQLADVSAQLNALLASSEVLLGAGNDFKPQGEGVRDGAFFGSTLLLARDPHGEGGANAIEVFGPVCSLMPYHDLDEALAIAARGKGSLVASLVTRDPKNAAHAIPIAATHHGRLLVLDNSCAAESTGHGSPLPHLKHGGPGRAGGGEELGGLRAVKHYLQRAAVQGSPSMLAAITGEYIRGAEVYESDIHPFRHHFEDLRIGESLLTHRRTVTEADLVNFGGVSGDYFYMHFDQIAAQDSQFGQRVAHGYFVLAAAAGLFVSPGPGPVLANYGLDNLRFVAPVGIGDTLQARLTCKRKTDQGKQSPQGQSQGVVTWDVEVSNQHAEVVASYDILTLVMKREPRLSP